MLNSGSGEKTESNATLKPDELIRSVSPANDSGGPLPDLRTNNTLSTGHDLRAEVDRNGFAIVRNVFNPESIALLEKALHDAGITSEHGSRRIATRVPQIGILARSSDSLRLVSAVLGKEAFLVQSIFFDKSRESNWKVPWHQDQTIPVKAHIPVPGFGGWSVKSSIPHVQAPANVLEEMLILRLHLDECNEENGALRVLPGSHLAGKLGTDRIRWWRETVVPQL